MRFEHPSIHDQDTSTNTQAHRFVVSKRTILRDWQRGGSRIEKSATSRRRLWLRQAMSGYAGWQVQKQGSGGESWWVRWQEVGARTLLRAMRSRSLPKDFRQRFLPSALALWYRCFG